MSDNLFNTNTLVYINVLRELLQSPADKNRYGITHELIGTKIVFDPHEHVIGSSEAYIKHELDWYMSQDLCIKGHPGIESNKIWQHCATKYGLVNSNYGWCIFSDQNHNQFEHVIRHIVNDLNTKHACMYYTRPSIHTEYCDGQHANADMICTCYVSYLLRKGSLMCNVHMRSNDIWYGLRNDLAWQQYVQQMVVDKLNSIGIKCNCGKISWFADSLHIYGRNISEAEKMLEEYNA